MHWQTVLIFPSLYELGILDKSSVTTTTVFEFQCIGLKIGIFYQLKCVIILGCSRDIPSRSYCRLMIYLLKTRLVVWVNLLNVTAEFNRVFVCAKTKKTCLPFELVVEHGIKLKYAIPSYIGSLTTDVVLKLVTNH